MKLYELAVELEKKMSYEEILKFSYDLIVNKEQTLNNNKKVKVIKFNEDDIFETVIKVEKELIK